LLIIFINLDGYSMAAMFLIDRRWRIWGAELNVLDALVGLGCEMLVLRMEAFYRRWFLVFVVRLVA